MGNREWSFKEVSILKEYYFSDGGNIVKERLLQKGFIRTPDAIQRKASKLKIKGDPTRGGRTNLTDLTGDEFGKYVVIERGPDYISASKSKGVRWW